MKTKKATITFVDSTGLTLRYEGKTGYKCPREKLHLLPWHDLHKIFRIDASFAVKEMSGGICVPVFNHPHDLWVEANHFHMCCEGRIVSMSHDASQGNYNVIIELGENVFATAETFNAENHVGDCIPFVPDHYDVAAKTICGYID